MKTRLFAAAVAAMAISAGLSAQNINPTVEVVNTYEGRLLDVHKPLSQMAVPDSLLAFRLDAPLLRDPDQLVQYEHGRGCAPGLRGNA